MEKKLYWQVDSNGDLSVTCSSVSECSDIIELDFNSLEYSEQAEAQYTMTPVWYTDQEYKNLPDTY